jgi:hypothetical protein
MPVIPATWEAEMGGSQFKASPDKKKKIRSYLIEKWGLADQACSPSYVGDIDRRVTYGG